MNTVNPIKKVTVLGGGTFGTAISNIAGDNGFTVHQWMRNTQQVENIKTNRENTRYLPGYKLSKNIIPTTNLKEAVENAELIFVSVPSKVFREVVSNMGEFVTGNQMAVSTSKGIEESTFKLMSEIIRDETCLLKVGVICGPNLAKEIVQKMPSGTVAASRYEQVIKSVQQVLACSYFRVYANHDIYGVELGGVLKNIYAVCTGLATAMKLGDNTKAILLTRGLSEMSRFAVKMGANPLTFLGLSGVGDLVATCSSPLSRNFQIGFQLGEGKSLEEAVNNLGQVAEGVRTIKIIRKKAEELDVNMPILEGLYQILYNSKKIEHVIKDLMAMEQRDDVEFILPYGST